MFSSAMHSGQAPEGPGAWKNSPMRPEEQHADGQGAKKPASEAIGPVAGIKNKSGDTYFRTCSTIIGSESLTTEFGMGRV